MTALEVFSFPATGQCVYVLAFSTGDVKVGYTAQPRARFHQHNRSVRQMGASIVAAWCSKPHENARENERELIAFCARRGKLTTGGERGEYFTGVAYESIRDFALSLPFESERDVEPSRDNETSRCLACKLVDDRPLTALSLLHQVASGMLRIIDPDGNDVSRRWAGRDGLLPHEQKEAAQ